MREAFHKETLSRLKSLNETRPRVLYSSTFAEGIHLVEKGFNTDVACMGAEYHVQTEDWGKQNPFLVSRVFRNGAVVKSIKTSYEDVLPRGPSSEAHAIRLAMKIQHQQILDLLLSGKLL